MKIAKLTKDLLPKVIGLTAGATGGAMADRFLAGKVNPFILNGGKIALGAVVGAMLGKNKIVASIGDGLIAQGGAGLALQLLPAAEAVEGFNDNAIAGDDEVIVDTYSQDVSGVDDVNSDNAIGADMFANDDDLM